GSGSDLAYRLPDVRARVVPHGLRVSLLSLVVGDDTALVLGPDDVDAAGLWLLPGGVDVHTHFGMPLRPGITSRGWRESSEAALRGGTTTVVDFANPAKGEPLPWAVARWRDAADGACLCDYGLHVAVSEITPERLAELESVVAAGVPTVKAFLAYKGRLMLTLDEMRLLMRQVCDIGGHLLVHAEDGEMNAAAEAELVGRGRTGPSWHTAAHPPAAEIEAVRTAMLLAEDTGCPLTIVHLSTAGGLELIRGARAVGVDINAETCPQYLFRTDACYAGSEDLALTAIMSPPLRSEQDAAALRAGLAAGEISWLATDHCEFPLDLKRRGAARGFPAIPNGAAGVGERLLVAYTLGVRTGLLSPESWIRLCCDQPAAMMGLAGRKGRVAAGYDADLVLFDPEATGTVLPQGADSSLWAGDDWRGAVRTVWRRGERVVAHGRLVDAPGAGTFLPRKLR
ncbi:amidohydrolase family protein, partial [bacterium]|nr:amidohydrolase family protein [bacterium]